MPLKETFNAKVTVVLHCNPPIMELHSEELGFLNVKLATLNLTEKEIDALDKADKVTGTYIKDPKKGVVVTSLKPAR